MANEIPAQVQLIIDDSEQREAHTTADALRNLWLQYEPRSIEVIKANQRQMQETVGIPIPILKAIGKELSKVARKNVDTYIPLARLLWHEYGREGRVVSLFILGAMELVQPETIVPLLKELCRTCFTWEDADRLAMDALEPIVRKKPDEWLGMIESWLSDDNKWVRRAGITVIGRLAMKHSSYTKQCLELSEQLLFDDDQDVKRAVSFAIRLCARGDITLTREFLAQHVPPENNAATWVLCDIIRSMAKHLLPELTSLLPHFEKWYADPNIDRKDRRSIESAMKKLHT